ncbi:MAG: RDD family protein [Candidatus Hodarchaeales archaeon]
MASVAKIISGLIILMIGFPIFIGGIGVLILVPAFTDSNGYFMTNSVNINETGFQAIRMDIPLDFHASERIDLSNFITLKMNAFGENAEEVFVGLCSSTDADKFLDSNISYLLITNVEFFSDWDLGSKSLFAIDYEQNVNTSNWEQPDITEISWLAGGYFGTEFSWAPNFEDVTVNMVSLIIMNSDLGSSNKIDVTFKIGAKIPLINIVGWILTIFGVLFILLAAVLLWSGFRTKKRRIDRIRYYQGAPATIIKDTPEPQKSNYRLQCSNCGYLNEPDSSFCSQCGEVLLYEDRKTLDDSFKGNTLMDQPEKVTSNRLIVADWGSRFWALVIDWLVVGAFTSTISSLLFLTFVNWQSWAIEPWSPFPWMFTVGPSSTLFFLYSVVMEYYYGQTLGKMALNLEVVSENNGQKPLIWDIIISAAGKAFFLPIDFILGRIVRDKSTIPDLNQRLTQKWSNTVIIRKKDFKDKSAHFVSDRL